MNTIDLKSACCRDYQPAPRSQGDSARAGFKPLANPAMLNTVGKVTSLRTGSKMTKISLDRIQQVLECNGYEVIGGEV